MSRQNLVIAALVGVAALAAVAVFAMGFAGGAGSTGQGPRQTVPAPIERVDVRVMESNPPQYAVQVRAGLPSGCAKQHSHSVSRAGETISITVLNTMPTGNPVCTLIYGVYDLNINLGSDFVSGLTYTVRVNDRVTSFRAQ
jgi:hypothetical protein